jgi:amidase
LPVSVKDLEQTAGLRTTFGSKFFEHNVPTEDGAVAGRLRAAGAVIVGKTNTPHFGHKDMSDNLLMEPSRNPWKLDRTPGGSSGGAAACVATGMGAIANGNDRAGSVRHPAYCCGVFGIRPTLGRVPTFEGTSPDEIAITTQLAHVQGVLARTVDDLRLGFEATMARDARDPWWVPVPLRKELPPPGRIALCTTGKVDAAVGEALRQAAKWLEDAGYRVEEAEPPRLEEAGRLFFTLVVSEGIASKEDKAGTSRAIEAYGDEPCKRARRSMIAAMKPLDYEGYINAWARRAAILRQWMLFFERYQALLLPVSRVRPFPVDEDQRGDAAMAALLEANVPMLAASTLGLPGLAAPATLAEGVPVGVQLIGPRYGEEMLFAAGAAIGARQHVMTGPIDPRA